MQACFNAFRHSTTERYMPHRPNPRQARRAAQANPCAGLPAHWHFAPLTQDQISARLIFEARMRAGRLAPLPAWGGA